MATSSLKKSFVINSKTEASKLVKMFSESIARPEVPKRGGIATASPELLKEIVRENRN